MKIEIWSNVISNIRSPIPFTAKELMAMDLPPIRWVVPGLVPEGLTVFAGKS